MPDIGGQHIIHFDLKKKTLDSFLNIPKEERYNNGYGKEIGGIYEIDLRESKDDGNNGHGGGEPCDIFVIVPENLHQYDDEWIIPCQILMEEEHAKIGKEDEKRVRKLVTMLTREGASVNSHRKIGHARTGNRSLIGSL